ncbi:MAG TPA: hypothetical protein VK035_06390 [Kiloniellales bacterium]|nr:hypothetical protein [Kiloniellales bacterium]
MPAKRLLLASLAGALLFMGGEELPLLDRQTAVQEAAAQQFGRNAWGWSRNKSMAAQFQHADRLNRDRAAGDLNQYVFSYSSNSSSIGNYTTIEQILEGNAQGSLDFLANQDSSGNQGANAGAGLTASDLSNQASNSSSKGKKSGKKR